MTESECPKCGAAFYQLNPAGKPVFECRSVFISDDDFIQNDRCLYGEVSKLHRELSAVKADNERLRAVVEGFLNAYGKQLYAQNSPSVKIHVAKLKAALTPSPTGASQ